MQMFTRARRQWPHGRFQLAVLFGVAVATMSMGGAAAAADPPHIHMTITPSKLAPAVGSNVTFTIVLHNTGGDAARLLLMGQAENYGRIDGDYENDNCFYTGPAYPECLHPGIASGETQTFHLRLRLTSNVANTMECGPSGWNSFEVSFESIAADSITEDDTGYATACLRLPKPDVAIKAAAAAAAPGQNVTFTLTARNVGTAKAPDVWVTDPVPANYSYVSNDGGCGLLSGKVQCPLNTMAAGAAKTIHVVLKLNSTLSSSDCPSGTSSLNTVYISSTPADANTANNRSRACVAPASAPARP